MWSNHPTFHPWLVVEPTPLKNVKVSWDHSQDMEKLRMFQTTNQIPFPSHFPIQTGPRWLTLSAPRQGVVANVAVTHLQHLTLPGTSGVWIRWKTWVFLRSFFLGNGMLMDNDYGMFMGYNIPMLWVMIIILIVIAKHWMLKKIFSWSAPNIRRMIVTDSLLMCWLNGSKSCPGVSQTPGAIAGTGQTNDGTTLCTIRMFFFIIIIKETFHYHSH